MKKKKLVVGLVVVSVLIGIVFVLVSREEPRELAFSVHDLNWDDYKGMNERIVDASFTNPPYVYDDDVHGLGYLNVVLSFFRDNLDLVSDRQRGRRLSFRVQFSGITGEESFLGDIPPSVWQENNGEFELSFYFDRSLERDFFDVLNEASGERFRSENPDAFNEERITLAEVDWDALRVEYEEHIFAISLEAPTADNQGFVIAVFHPTYDDLSVIFDFLERNQDEVAYDGSDEYRYIGVINFKRENESDPLVYSRFFMNEMTSVRLRDAIGEEAWEAAQR